MTYAIASLAFAIIVVSVVWWDRERRGFALKEKELTAKQENDRGRRFEIDKVAKDLGYSIGECNKRIDRVVEDLCEPINECNGKIVDTNKRIDEVINAHGKLGTRQVEDVSNVIDFVRKTVDELKVAEQFAELEAKIVRSHNALKDRNDSQIVNALKEVHDLLKSFTSKQAGALAQMGGVRGRLPRGNRTVGQ